MTTPNSTLSVSILGPMLPGFETILTPEALTFLAELHHRFNARRSQLLEDRTRRQTAIDAGELPDFIPATKAIREAQWRVAPIPQDLKDRRVEITGPVDRKMIINALNSGASVFMADLEDSNSPTWANVISGQVNLRDAVKGEISYTSPEGKVYAVGAKSAVLMVRPRGWHLLEQHLQIDGTPYRHH